MKKVSQKKQIENLKDALKHVASYTGPTSPSTKTFVDLASQTLATYDKPRLPPKPQKNRMILTRADGLGEHLHSALRKACDSFPTTIAWNLISMDAFTEAWDEYLGHAEKALARQCVTPETAWMYLRSASDEIQYGRHAHAALRKTFEMFDENDWQGMSGLLGEI